MHLQTVAKSRHLIVDEIEKLIDRCAVSYSRHTLIDFLDSNIIVEPGAFMQLGTSRGYNRSGIMTRNRISRERFYWRWLMHCEKSGMMPGSVTEMRIYIDRYLFTIKKLDRRLVWFGVNSSEATANGWFGLKLAGAVESPSQGLLQLHS